MPTEPGDTEADRDAHRQFVIFVGSIVAAIGITVASFLLATSAR